MRRHRKWTACALIVALLLPLLAPSLTLLPQKTGAEELNFGNAHITPYHNKDASGNVEGPPTWRYAVGFMSYDIWRNSSGVWSPKKPGDAVTGSDNLKWTYTFSFTDRIVRNVDAYIFNPANSEHIEFFEMSRGTSFKPYEYYVSPVSDITKSNEIGKGTSSITFDIALSGSLSGVSQPIPCDSCNEGVQGLRYYFPIVFKFELDGLKTTRFFSTTGEKLRDEEKTNMEKGRTISTTPPAISGYRYVGYKKSTDGNSPAGEIIPGPPPSFTYDGSFDHYIIQLYYEPDTAPDKPDLVAVDITANGPIEVGKPANFTAKWRLDHKSLQPNQCYNVKIMEGATNLKIEQFCGTQQGQQLTMNFTYTFTSEAQKTFLLVVDSANAIAESNENNNQVSKPFAPSNPAGKSFTGDFDVQPSVIHYRDSFQLVPKNFVLNGCAYQSHRYRMERGGVTWVSGPVLGQNTVSSFTRTNYPYVLGIGTHEVYMQITTDCGTSEWIGPKTLIVQGPAQNSPPVFQLAWVYPWDRKTPVTQVVEGTVLDLVYIDDPDVPTPYDPDGDSFHVVGFDFTESTPWARQIPSKYTLYVDGYRNIVMDGLGTHTAKMIMADQWGATTVRTAVVTVVPPNPIPIIDGPKEVVEGRPLPQPFSSERSYSPVGRAIDHSRDEWTNVKTVYATPGKEIITLHVYDSIGMKSVQPAVHELLVKEDMPPVPALRFPSPSIRNAPVTFREESYSPDNDVIVKKTIDYRYDADNDGNFAEEPKHTITLNADRTFTFTPAKVGVYRFTVYVEEDWGKSATQTFDLTVVNDAPTWTFDISSEVQEPVVIPDIPVPMTQLTGQAAWVNSDFLRANKLKSWAVNPYTGWLSHSPSFLSNSVYRYVGYMNTSWYVGGYNDGKRYNNVLLPAENGFDVYEVNDYEDIQEVYLGQGIWFWSETSGSAEYRRMRSIPNMTGGGYFNREYGEVFQRYDAYNQWVYTVKYEYNKPPEYRKYRLQDFLNPAGVHFAVVSEDEFVGRRVSSANTGDLSAGINDRALPYGFFYCKQLGYDASVLGYNYELMVFDWAGNLLDSGIRTNACPQGALDGSMNVYSMAQLNGSKFVIYNPTARTFTYVPWNDFYYANSIMASWDGKIIYNTSTRNYYDIATQQIVGTAASPPVFTDFEDRLLFNIRQDFPLSLNIYGTQIDAEGNVYYYDHSDKKVKVWNYFTRQIKEIYDLKTNGLSYAIPDQYNQPVIRYPGVLVLGLKDSILYMEPRGGGEDNPRNILSLQQLTGPVSLSDLRLGFKIRFHEDDTRYLYAGAVFHYQDNRNMYRMELNRDKVRIVKVVDGRKIVLASADYHFEKHREYAIRVQAVDGRIRGYVGGVPLLDVTDHSYEEGTFGIFSELPTTEFAALTYADLGALGSTSKRQNVALVDRDVEVISSYQDTENDPIARQEWTYVKVQEKFLDAGDGKSGPSALHNRTFASPQPRFDKVGVYEVSSAVTDDPHPDYPYPSAVFGDYRMVSNTAVRTVIVHRAPVVDYDVFLNPDGTVGWVDRSHDPDRWLSGTSFSTEPTGIDYAATKGILQKKFYYITPGGQWVEDKLVTPTELGVYTVGMAVKDEYDAWSPFLEKTIHVTHLPSPDEPPVAEFSVTPATAYRGVQVTIESQSWDKEDGGRENLKHTYYLKNLTTGDPETVASASRTVWTKTFSTLGTFRIRLLVEDSRGHPAEAVRTVTVVNRKPQADVTTPASTSASKPTRFDVLRPTFAWSYSDADGDAQSQYQVRIYRTDGSLERDTGARSGSAKGWTPTADLPERVTLYIRVRVHDGYDWSDWSAPKYFFIETNRPPVADFDWSPKPTYEGDTITLIDRSTDPDGDPLTYQWSVSGPNGYTRSGSDQTFVIPGSDTENRTGTYNVTLTVRDPKGASDSVTKSITVLPLTIEGEVHHTPEWNENRINYNKKVSGKTDEPRSYDIFWAGERFVLRADTTLTGTATKADTVTVHMDRGYSTTLSPNGNFSIWNGELYDKSFDRLKDGPVTFTFEAHYNNGVVKVDTVTVRIEGNYTDYFRIHRTK